MLNLYGGRVESNTYCHMLGEIFCVWYGTYVVSGRRVTGEVT